VSIKEDSLRSEALGVVVQLLFELDEKRELDDFYDRICEAVCLQTSMERAVLFLYDAERRLVLPAGSHGVYREFIAHGYGSLEETPIELDINSEEDLSGLATEIEERWGGLDGALHAIAFAPADAIGGRFMETPPESAAEAFRTSAYSFQALARHLAPLMDGGGSVVGLDFDASVAWPSYDWMGVSKAALEAVNRYLARELGPRGIRSNLISAGPISSPAAGGIDGFDRLASDWPAAAPLGWDTEDPAPVARAVCFLLSEWSEAISGEVIHVDGGAHAVGGMNGVSAPASLELASR
jgi:enoyl ACP reductase